MSDDYEIGYGKPPRHSRFSKGKSGNPSGRRKPRLSDAEVVAKIRDQKITIKLRGKEMRVTTLEAAILQTINKTIASGKPRDLECLLRLLDKYGALPFEVRQAEGKAQAQAAVDKIMEIFDRTRRPEPPEGYEGQTQP